MTRTTRFTTRAVRFAGAALALAAVGLVTSCDPGPPRCNGLPATIAGTAGNDTLTGTEGPDVIAGLAGQDHIIGLGGNDQLCSGAGTDHVEGGDGADTINGSRDTDRLDGGPGTDTLSYQGHPFAVQVDLARGKGGDLDVISGFEDVVGSSFTDFLAGDAGPNRLVGGPGSDTIAGEGGDDQVIDGGSSSTAERNLLFGGPGNDIFYGGAAYDVVSFRPSAAAVWVNLASGLASGEGDDIISGADEVVGSMGNDTLIGDPGRNVFDGDAGDDFLWAKGGDDKVDGGPGRDTMSWFGASAMIIADLETGSATGEGNDSFTGIEDLGGGNGSDLLKGDKFDNIIDGSNGIDGCFGRGGVDTLLHCD